jgi:hypothetical protein
MCLLDEEALTMNVKHFKLVFALMLSGLILAALLFAFRLPASLARANTTIPVVKTTADGPPTLPAILESDMPESHVSQASMGTVLSAGGTSIVQHGSIITGVNPVMTGRLIRNGVPGICGQDFTCSGVQSTSTPFSYESFNFLNPSTDWQCVQVTMDTRSCGEQVYSAAYVGAFDPVNQCTNVQSEMGFSTSGVYGYSFMVPPNTNFTIVNNTTGIVPPSANCTSYVMTTTLCSADIAVAATKRAAASTIMANSLGKAVVPVDVVFQNTGTFTAAVSAEMVSETVTITVMDNQPAVAQVTFGHAGAIVPPGRTTTETVMLDFSGSQFTCLPRTYQITSVLDMTAGVYHCDGFNPPSAEVYAGSVSPQDDFDEDAIAFQSLPGTYITATVDTVSAATAFDIEACISGTPTGSCLPDFQGDDDFTCTFPPPSFACPRFGGVLPDDPDNDNIYYLRINSGSGAGNFAGPTGDYRASLLVTSGPTGACPVVPVLDNGQNSFLQLAEVPAQSNQIAAIPAPTTPFKATVLPITIFVPPSNPAAPGCSQVYLPSVLR